MRRLWSDDEVTHHGRYYNVTGARPTARPYQKPHPKIWQAAMSDPAVRRVGRGGDILYVGPAQSNATIRHQISLYHQTLEENGHDVPEDMVIVREFFCAPTHEEALERARANFAKKYEVYAYHGLHGTDDELTRKVTGDLETLMGRHLPGGQPGGNVSSRLLPITKWGSPMWPCGCSIPRCPRAEVLEHIDLVGREVIPALHAL